LETAAMNRLSTVLSLAATVLLFAGCKNSGNDPLPPTPNQPTVNLPPTANAGADQLVLTGAAVGLNGSGSDSDGSIASLAWAQSSGTAVTLTGANTGTPSFTAPGVAATLVFDLTVTDNSGAARTDSVTVTVNGAPVANAGTDQTVVMGANVTLSGSGTDDGSVASYAWTQTAGAAVTLTGGATAAPTFSAPASVGVLQFQLTVTDNQGATNSDSVSVTVNSLAAPVIVRQPTNVIAYQHGMALMFVVAQGENLNYEWRYQSGVVASSGPEPYMLRGSDVSGLSMLDDGRCFYVVVSNAAGSVASEDGCLTVVEMQGDLEPDDDDPSDNWSAAVGYGNATLEIVRIAAGGITGIVPSSNRSAVPSRLGSGFTCLDGGAYLGATLDGQAITQATDLPLGQHTITEIWEECRNGGSDVPRRRSGGVMITYDFPDVFGVGSYTLYLSGHGEVNGNGTPWGAMNGILHVTISRTVGSTGLTHDEIEITLEPHFGASSFRLNTVLGSDYITLDRRLNADETVITDATLDWRVEWNVYDGGGFAGSIYKGPGSSDDIELHHFFGDDDGDTDDPISSEGEIIPWITNQFGNWYLGKITAVPGTRGWQFVVEEETDDGE
jgi:hypothetical protein